MPEMTRVHTRPKPVQVGLHLFAVISAFLGGYLAFEEKTGPATLLMVTAVVAFVFTKFDRIEHFKALGIEAKMLKETVAEAHEIVGQMQALAVSTARHIITLVSGGEGDTQTYSKRTAWEMVENVRSSLENLKISQSEIDDVLEPYQLKVLNDLGNSFQNLVANGALSVLVFNSGSTDAQLLSKVLEKASLAPMDPDEWKRVADNVSHFKHTASHDKTFKAQDLLELVKDLECWHATRQLRRPEEYFR